MLEASTSASYPSLRFLISSSHSLLRSTVTSRLSWQMVQVNEDSALKSSLKVSTRRILSQFQSSRVVGLMSTSGVSSSSLSSSMRMAREMYLSGCFSLRITAQQESMLRTPPHTIFRSLTWYVEERLIIFQNRSGPTPPPILPTERSQILSRFYRFNQGGGQVGYRFQGCVDGQQFQFSTSMSASLPRIKTVHVLPKHPSIDIPKEIKVKFRRLTLDEPSENVEERRKSIKTIKSSRLNSLERYTTVQEQRQFKNEKIHLNLIERKLLAGTYDEKSETGNELTGLKNRRDQMRVDMATKQKEIQRVRALLEDVRQETQVFLSRKGEHDEKLKEIKERSDAQQLRAEATRETRNVLENMIVIRENVNIVLSKRHYALKEELNRLKSALTLMDTELREGTEKCAVQEAKLEGLLKQATRQRQQRNEQISKHQEKISKRKDGEVMHAEKSRKYIAYLDDVERTGEVREFKTVYDKILANLFVSRYAKMRMIDLTERFEKYETAYNTVKAYRSFDIENPKTLVKRFFEHQPELTHIQAEIKLKEDLQASGETRNNELKAALQRVTAESEEIEESFNLSHHAENMTKEHEAILGLKRDVDEVEEKAVRIKTDILRMMKDLNQKADKRVYTGNQTTVNNLTLLTTLLREAFRQAH